MRSGHNKTTKNTPIFIVVTISPELMKKLLSTILILLPLSLLAQDNMKYKASSPVGETQKGTINLEMPAGELHLKTGSTQLIDAEINYGKAEWKPSMKVNREDDNTSLTMKQKDFKNKEGNVDNIWNISLNKSVPLNLNLTMGAGKSDIDLSNSRLEKLEIKAGAVSCDIDLRGSTVKDVDIAAGVGELNLDMTGNWNHNVNVEIAGGIGEVNLKLPKNTGVRLSSAGLGSRHLPGFVKKGNYYQNAAYGKSKHTVTVNVSGGMGSLNVVEG